MAGGELADLVEKERPAVRELEASVLLRDRAGEAPRSWPNSSLSSSVSVSAAQLTATNGRLARGLSMWMARAAISLPVPVSPVSRTVVWARETRRMVSLSARMGGLSPTSFGSGASSFSRSVSRSRLATRRTFSSAIALSVATAISSCRSSLSNAAPAASR